MPICPCCGQPTKEVTFFQTVFDYATSKFPDLAIGNYSCVHQWREKGYSFETHVKPAIDCIAKDKRPTWAYINGIIQNNLKPMAEAPVKVEASPERLAEIKEWKRAHGMYVA